MSTNGMGPEGNPPGGSPFSCLTLREREVAQYITHGRSNKYIAAELQVSRRTIEAHRARIFSKVGVRNAVELTQRCVRWHMKLPRTTDDCEAGRQRAARPRVPAAGAVRAPVGARHRRASENAGFIAPGRLGPVSQPARRSGRDQPVGSGAQPAAAAGH
ncbi:hypothetical protein CCAE64S_01851 [Castellaniella caeni]